MIAALRVSSRREAAPQDQEDGEVGGGGADSSAVCDLGRELEMVARSCHNYRVGPPPLGVGPVRGATSRHLWLWKRKARRFRLFLH